MSMTDKLNIARERRALKLLKRLDERRSEGKFDFTIVVGTDKIYAEQNVLASGSEYFDAMLSHDTKEKRNARVEMIGVEFESVKLCVGYIYGREVVIPPANYQNLMYVAQMMQLIELCDAIEEEMTAKLNAKSIFSIRKTAIMFGCTDLLAKCQNFAEDNVVSISQQKKFHRSDKTFVKGLVTSQNVRLAEEIKLQIILAWVKYKPQRGGDLFELIQCVDIPRVPYEIAQSYIDNEPSIFQNSECLAFFRESMMTSLKRFTPFDDDVTIAGKIVIFDGNSSCLRVYEPVENITRTLRVKQPDLESYSIVNVDDYLHVLSGDGSVFRLKYTEDGATWKQMADMIANHGLRPSATVLSGFIYVIGGGDVITTAVERYDCSRNEWTKLRDRPRALEFAEVLGSGGFIYSFGGWINGGEVTNDVVRYDVTKSQWSTLSAMNESKELVSAAELENLIYVAGGFDGDQYLTSLERYDPLTNQWTMLSSMKVGRSWFRVVAIDRCLYAVGGAEGLRNGSVERYDVDHDEWKIVFEDDKMNALDSVAI